MQSGMSVHLSLYNRFVRLSNGKLFVVLLSFDKKGKRKIWMSYPIPQSNRSRVRVNHPTSWQAFPPNRNALPRTRQIRWGKISRKISKYLRFSWWNNSRMLCDKATRQTTRSTAQTQSIVDMVIYDASKLVFSIQFWWNFVWACGGWF